MTRRHEALIRRMLTELHEPWMNEQDGADFDAEVLRQFGDQLDADIEAGIANGSTEEQQEVLVRQLFQQWRKSR